MRSTSWRVSASSSRSAASSAPCVVCASGARTRSLTVVSVTSAIRLSRGIDGDVTPRSQRETVIDSTPSWSASCRCVNPALRRAMRTRAPTPPLSLPTDAFLSQLCSRCSGQRWLGRRSWTHLDEHLPHVLPAEESEQRRRCVLHAIDDRFSIAKPILADPPPGLLEEFREAVVVVGDDVPVHAQPLGHDHEQVARPGRRLERVVAGDGTARHDASVRTHLADRRLQVVSRDVVEVDVDALGRRRRERVAHRVRAVVEDGVEAELSEPPELLRRATEPSESAHSRQPRLWTTKSPSANDACREAATCPTAPPVIASPSVNGAT